ncbi:hypothetical protein CCM_06724 [Cordyceps militaris CM01]|uniref:Uncharacterized protein n=1 Tax=Cordyceps militaris (strain CM01) TaxID=983644 RepID=G3JKT3_CORMM|nr:uncharacterized protein CCM_06724 [Cordyceps militaris CM01]EGX90307.1 hypothetical protein CCM_06724 [Cordyceps militaris CM01]
MKTSVATATLAALTSADPSTFVKNTFSTVYTTASPIVTPSPPVMLKETSSRLFFDSATISQSDAVSPRLQDRAISWPSSFEQFGKPTHTPTTSSTAHCKSRADQWPSVFEQFPSKSGNKPEHKSQTATKPPFIPDPNCAHPPHIFIPPPSIPDPWGAHPERISVTFTTSAETPATTTAIDITTAIVGASEQAHTTVRGATMPSDGGWE